MARVAPYAEWVKTAQGQKAGGSQAGYSRYQANMAAINQRQGNSSPAPKPSGGVLSAPQSTSKGVVADYDSWKGSAPGRTDQAGYNRYLQNMGVTGGVGQYQTGVQPVQMSSGGGSPLSVRWKPHSEANGNLVVLADTGAPMSIVDAEGRVLSRGVNTGASNGYGATVRFDRPGRAFTGDVYLQVGNQRYAVPNPGIDAGVGNRINLQPAGGQTARGTTPQGVLGGGAIPEGAIQFPSQRHVQNFEKSGNGGLTMQPGQVAYYQDPQTGQTFQITNTLGRQTVVGLKVNRSTDGQPVVTAVNEDGNRMPVTGARPASQPSGGGGGGGGAVSGGGGGGGHSAVSGGGGATGAGILEPFTREVVRPSEQEPYETVRGQITDLLDSGSTYIERARHYGRESAAERGLLNSTLAGQSAEAAAIDAALPIAQQDASTFFSQGVNNQNAINRFREQEMLNAFRQQQMRLGAELDLQMLDAGHGNSLELAYLNAQTSMFNNPYLSPQQQALGSQRLGSLYGYSSAYSASYL